MSISVKPLFVLLLAAGAGTIVASLGFLVWRARKGRPGISPGSTRNGKRSMPTSALAGVIALVIVSLALGLEGIERHGITHVESYVPGIDLPAGISEPPPRHDLVQTLRWHLLSEPHPPGYFLFMWGWTKVFGTSMTSIRLPSVLFGGAAVLLIFFVGSALGNRSVGLISALLLALNGHHIYWMQWARQYEMALFLGLVSTWCWIKMLSANRPMRRVEILYALSTVAGLYTHVLFWFFHAAQMLFTLWRRTCAHTAADRTYPLQTLVVMLGSPMIAHALTVGRRVASGGELTLGFAQDYLNFGFLFTPDIMSTPPRDIGVLPELGLSFLAILSIVAFLSAPRFRWGCSRGEIAQPEAFPLVGVAGGGISLLLLACAVKADRSRLILVLTALVPIFALVQLALTNRLEWLTRRFTGPAGRATASPAVALSFGTFGLVGIVCIFMPVAVSRGLLLAVPPLLIVIAGGLDEIRRRSRIAGTVAILVAVAASLSSVLYAREIPRANDYRGAAAQMLRQLEPGDLIFVKNRDWVTTPLFYYLKGEHHRLVAANYTEALRNSEARRVWVPSFEDTPVPYEIRAAISGLTRTNSLSSLRTTVTLYEALPPKDGS